MRSERRTRARANWAPQIAVPFSQAIIAADIDIAFFSPDHHLATYRCMCSQCLWRVYIACYRRLRDSSEDLPGCTTATSFS